VKKQLQYKGHFVQTLYTTSFHYFTMTAGERIAAEQVPGQDNISESVVTFSDANPVDAASPFGGSSISTTRTVVVDATKHLEASSASSGGKLIPGVKDVTNAVHDGVRHAKHCVSMFRVDNEIFQVNKEQLDRVRMSKCSLEGVGEKTYGFGL
jgi:hypothetical protein